MEKFIFYVERDAYTRSQRMKMEEEAEKLNGGNITIYHGMQNQFVFNTEKAKNNFSAWMAKNFN